MTQECSDPSSGQELTTTITTYYIYCGEATATFHFPAAIKIMANSPQRHRVGAGHSRAG